MGTQESLQVVKDAYAAFGRGDIATLLASLTEDVSWHVPGTGLALSGTYNGRDGVGQFFQRLSAETEILAFQPDEFIAQDDRVVVLGSSRYRILSTGRIFEGSWVMAFTVRDGKVSTFHEYYDTQALAAAYALTARAAG